MRPRDDDSAIIDAFLDSYVWWREACDDVWSAYWAWNDCDLGERARRFAAYQSALDREETTAIMHRERALRLSAPGRERLRRRQPTLEVGQTKTT
jgi:hypothetical protein